MRDNIFFFSSRRRHTRYWRDWSSDVCSSDLSLAYMDVKDAPELNMPQPDFVACCNNICNCMIKWYENLAKECNVPLILIDVPYNNDYEAGDDRVEYLRGQFDYAIKQLRSEEHTSELQSRQYLVC